MTARGLFFFPFVVNQSPIYLDYNATTPLDPAVVEAMLPYLQTHFGNPSSTHAYGKQAHAAVEHARAQVAEFLGAQTDEIVFTSGGSEATNQALKGVLFPKLRGVFGLRGLFMNWFFPGFMTPVAYFVTTTIEHPATLQTCDFLKRLGCRVTQIGVDRDGRVDLTAVRDAIIRRTTIVSIMHANNEVGTLQPVSEIAAIARKAGVLVHTDAAQSAGKVPVNVNELGVHLLSLAGHKLYAPKGIGALYVRRGVKLEPLIHGAGQEMGRRAGTENVPYIVGFGKACEIARLSLPQATERLRRLRDHLWFRLQSALGTQVVLNGHPEQRLPNTLNVNFVGHIGSELLQKVPEIAASTGSACHEGHVSVSPVLCAMRVPPEASRGAVRLSVGRFTTETEVDQAADALIGTANQTR